MDDLTLANARSKLLWASQSEWSASLSPQESAAVLKALVNPPATGTVDKRPPMTRSQEQARLAATFGRRPQLSDDLHQGDPGDEHHEPR